MLHINQIFTKRTHRGFKTVRAQHVKIDLQVTLCITCAYHILKLQIVHAQQQCLHEAIKSQLDHIINMGNVK